MSKNLIIALFWFVFGIINFIIYTFKANDIEQLDYKVSYSYDFLMAMIFIIIDKLN